MCNKLLGVWKADPDDKTTSELYGNVVMEFKNSGDLIYIISEANMEKRIFLKYEIVNDILITDQPSFPNRQETKFTLDDSTLELYFDNVKSRYIKFEEMYHSIEDC